MHKDEMKKLREDAVRAMITSIGEDPSREGLIKTPHRVAKMYDELFSGYDQDPIAILKSAIFTNMPGDDIVLIRDIEFFSHCEHHMVPFFGKVHVAYIPRDNKVVGISKIARIVDVFAKRLQIQERMNKQIEEAMRLALDPIGIAVIIQADHMCMKMRGIKNPCANTVTSHMTGAFRDNIAAREELMQLINMR